MTGSTEPQRTAALTDSAWFWLMLFCLVGVALLALMSPKYARRQQRLELQYQAQQEIERRRLSEPRAESEQPLTAPPAAGELIIPLTPLLSVFIGLFFVSAYGLWRSRRGVPPGTAPPGT